MIIIGQNVLDIIDEYVQYLIREGLTSSNRAKQKKMEMVHAVNSNLGGILNHRLSPYRELGKAEHCRLYVYKDPKSKTQWGFAYKQYGGDNVIVYHMRNLKLIR